MKLDTKYIQHNKDILLKILEEISSIKSIELDVEDEITNILRRNTTKDGKTLSKYQVLEGYKKLEKTLNLTKQKRKQILDLVRMKKIRTLSGVTPVAVLTKPYPCPGNCIYCPNDPKMPKSYLSMEPGAQRALSNDFDPYLQVYNRLLAFKNIGHPTDKVELIVLGGTWSYYPEKYQIWFIKRCFDAMNKFDPLISKDGVEISSIKEKNNKEMDSTTWKELFSSQKINESSKSRCVGLVLETRPDYISEDEVLRLRKLGATKIQIGVQSLHDDVLKANRRGHGVKETSCAFKLLRSAGFKIHAHWMPNLWGSNPKKDVMNFKKLFSDKRFKPDELKIYPCSLIKDTELFNYYKDRKWFPYSDKELLFVLENCLSNTPEYCRITRMIRDISSDDIVTGNKKSNFRQIVEKEMQRKNKKIREIRFREIKNEKVGIENLKLKKIKYETASSWEYFLEYVTKEDKIVAFLRLSLPKHKSFVKELDKNAIIREIHVYGQTLEIGKEEKDKSQHIGLGRKLIKEAENISKDKGFKSLSVISSIGTREYYSKNGFNIGTLYQTKDIS